MAMLAAQLCSILATPRSRCSAMAARIAKAVRAVALASNASDVAAGAHAAAISREKLVPQVPRVLAVTAQ